MNDFNKITPLTACLLESVSDPDLPIAGLPPIYFVQGNSRCLLNLPSGPITRTSPAQWPAGSSSLTGRAALHAFASGLHLRGLRLRQGVRHLENLPGTRVPIRRSHPEMPEDANWQEVPTAEDLSRQQGPCRGRHSTPS